MSGRSVSSVPSLSASHTSSEQWQSFERRMRERRAERCLRQAHTALTSGRISDARRACAAAREMDPTLPALRALEGDIETLSARRRHRILAPAAVCSAALALAASIAWHASIDSPPPLTRPVSAGADIVLSVPAGSVSSAPPPVEPASGPPDPEPSSRNAAVPQQQPREGTVEPPRLGNRRPLDPAAPARAGSIEPSSLPAVEATAVPVVPSAESDEESPAAPPTAGDRTAAEPRADTAAIRRTLARYEAAYTDLDASAARAVWPSVDQRALARAFEGLAAQRIALNDCDVLVTGSTARATCSGAATWTAKVGGVQRSEARRWAFELKNEAGSWQIVRAETR
jgi:hypothetical protein